FPEFSLHGECIPLDTGLAVPSDLVGGGTRSGRRSTDPSGQALRARRRRSGGGGRGAARLVARSPPGGRHVRAGDALRIQPRDGVPRLESRGNHETVIAGCSPLTARPKWRGETRVSLEPMHEMTPSLTPYRTEETSDASLAGSYCLHLDRALGGD